MIEDTGLRVQNIADSYFPNQSARSRFLEEMQNNMKKYSGIPLYMSNEELSEERNEQNEKDYYEGTEKSLVSGDMSNPVDYNNVISNIDAYATMEKSYPSTVVYAAFTDKEFAESMQTDDAFFINAANTAEDYPVWVTRTNIVNSVLLDAMENDEASIFSQVKRVAVPTGLAIGFEALKSTAGAFLASGLSAAYDPIRLGGQSIYNVQKKYKQRYMDIISNKNLNQEQTLEAAKKMFEDLKAEVPEEYRYEIYKGIYERPDPFADFGQAFSGATLEAGWRTLKAGVRDSTGMFRGMKEYSKKSLNKVKHIGQPNQGIEELDMNDELVKKIENYVNNKVSEETVDAVVEHKAAVKAPKTPEETTPEKEEVVKDIIKEKEIDNNLLLNNNGDHLSWFAAHTGYTNIKDVVSDFFNSPAARKVSGYRVNEKGEINLSGKDLKEAVIIEHGKGVDGNMPFTYEEAQQWLKTEQGRNQPVNYAEVEPHSLEFNPDTAKDYIQIQTASPDAWSTDPNVRGQFDYEGHHPGENGQAFGGGGYAGVPDSGGSSAEKNYFGQFDMQKTSYYPKELVKFNDGFVTDVINLRQSLLGASKDKFFNNNNKYYKRALEMIDPDGEIESKVPGYNRTYFTDGITDIGRYIKAFENDEDMMKALNIVFNTKESRDVFANGILINEHSFRDYNTNPRQVIFEVLYNKKDKHFIDEFIKNYEDELKSDIARLNKVYKEYEDLKIKYKATDADMRRFADRLENMIANGPIKGLSKNVEDKLRAAENTLFDLNIRVANVMFSQSKLEQLKEIAPKLKEFLKEGFTIEKEHPLNYKTTLNTHIIQNPEKRLDNLLWWNEEHGIQPLAYFYKGNKAQEAEDIMMEKISSVNRDIADGIYNALQKSDRPNELIEIRDKRGNIRRSFGSFIKGESLDDVRQGMSEAFYNMQGRTHDSLGVWEDLMRKYVYDPLPESEKAKYYDFKDWHSKYLTSKGIDITWHKGFSAGPWNNVVVHNTKMFQPVTKVETDIHKFKNWTQYIYDNGHGIYTEDGVNWKGLEVHAPDDAKPVIIEAGKIVDKP